MGRFSNAFLDESGARPIRERLGSERRSRMSKLRASELTNSNGTAMPDDTALFLIRDAVERRGGLIHGRLTDRFGNHCAIGCFWADNPKVTLHSSLIDEVAAVNDSVPPNATAKERWKKVRSWLRWKIKVLAVGRQD